MRLYLLSTVVFLAACGTSHTPDAGDATETDGSSSVLDGSTDLPDMCLVGTAIPCECPDAPPGFRFCIADGVFGECECSPPRPPTPDAGPDAGIAALDGSIIRLDGDVVLDDGAVAPRDASVGVDAGVVVPCTPGDEEWCDGHDNDCNGVIDNGHVCPDATVTHTLPHDLSVWMLGWRMISDRSSDAVRRQWPSVGAEVIDTRGGYGFRFDAAGVLHYMRLGHGVRRYVPGGAAVEVPTPPCFDGVRGLLGFDRTNRIYYTCGDQVRRGEGELLYEGPDGEELFHVLASGRVLSGRDAPTLREPNGALISRAPLADWVGTMAPLVGGTTVLGDSAFVSYNRTYRGTTRREVVILRVDADGTWRTVRRIPVPWALGRGIALPDGTFIGARLTDREDLLSGVITVFPPVGPATELWRDGPEQDLHFRGDDLRFFAAPSSF